MFIIFIHPGAGLILTLRILFATAIVTSIYGCQVFNFSGVNAQNQNERLVSLNKHQGRNESLMQLYIYKSSSYESVAEREGYFVMFNPAPSKEKESGVKNSPVIFFED